MPEIPFQPTKFQEVSFYDLPNLYVTQLLDGEFGENVVRNLFSRDRLSPEERDLYTDRIKQQVAEQLGGEESNLANWAIDLLTNPWVWAAAAITPGIPGAAFRGLGKTGIFQMSKEYKNKSPFLQQIGLFTNNQAFRNDPRVIETLLTIKNLRDDRITEIASIRGPALEALITNLGKKAKGIKKKGTIDYQAFAPGTEEYKLLSEVNDAIYIRLNGLDVDHITRMNALEADTGKLVYKEVLNPALVKASQVDDVIAKHGLQDYIDATRLALDEEFVHVFGNETRLAKYGGDYENASELLKAYRAGAFKQVDDAGNVTSWGTHSIIDVNKIFRLYRSRHLESVSSDPVGALADAAPSHKNPAYAFLDNWFGDSLQGIKTGEKTAKEMADEFAKIFSGQLRPQSYRQVVHRNPFNGKVVDVETIPGDYLSQGVYMPRSSVVPLSETGHLSKSFDDITSFNYKMDPSKPTVTAPGFVLQNVRGTNKTYEAGFLERLKETYGNNNRIERSLEKTQKFAEDAIDRAEILRGTSPNVERNLGAYFNQSANTYALYSGGTTLVRLEDGTVKRVLDPAIWHRVTDAQRRVRDKINDESSAMSWKKWQKKEIHPFVNQSGAPMPMQEAVGVSIPSGEAIWRGLKVDDVFGEIAKKGWNAEAKQTPLGGYGLVDALEQGYAMLDPHSKEIIRHVALPRAIGRRTLEKAAAGALTVNTKKMAHDLMNGPFGDMLSKAGGIGKSLVNKLKVYGDPVNLYSGRGQMMGKAAGYLYVTHLGLNPASVMLNLTQPLLTTANHVGLDNVGKAYGQAFKDLSRYLSLRKQIHGGKYALSPDEKERLIRKAFPEFSGDPSHDILNIGPSVLESLDAGIVATEHMTARNLKQWLLQDAPLKAFEKAEWFNRLVTAHATNNAYKGAIKKGLISADDIAKPTAANNWQGGKLWGQYSGDMRSMVEETQFGTGFLNTPGLFMEGFEKTGRAGWASGLLANPLMRQFMQFPLRMFTSAIVTPGQVAGGFRQFRNGKLVGGGNPAVPALMDLGRALGISAAGYYTIRDFTGAQPDRALYADSVMAFPNTISSIFGFTESPGGLQGFTPPAIAIGVNLGQGFWDQDMQSFGTAASRLLPGGIQLQRMMGVFDQSTGPIGDLTSIFQKTYADWDNPTPDGKVPVFKGDGTFVNYSSPTALIMAGAGLDMGKFGKERGDIDRYFLSQREEMQKYKAGFLRALAANDVSNAEKIRREYEKRFKIPFRVSKPQVDAFMKNRVVSRAERILDRMPPESRHLYAGYIAERGASGLPQEAFTLPTAGKRTEAYGRPELNIDPEMIQYMRKMTEEKASDRRLSDPESLTFLPYSARQ